MRRQASAFAFIVVAALLVWPSTARGGADDSSLRVQLIVEGDEDIKREVVSYLARSMRSLGDIIAVDSEPLFKLRVAAAKIELPSKEHAVVLSVVVESMLPGALVSAKVRPKLSATDAEHLKMLAEYGAVVDHFVRTADAVSLEALCRKVVADVDGKQFEAGRTVVKLLRGQK